MKAKLLSDDHGQKTFAVIFDTGDSVVPALLAFALERRLAASHFTAIGAFQELVLGYFDWQLASSFLARSKVVLSTCVPGRAGEVDLAWSVEAQTQSRPVALRPRRPMPYL